LVPLGDTPGLSIRVPTTTTVGRGLAGDEGGVGGEACKVSGWASFCASAGLASAKPIAVTSRTLSNANYRFDSCLRRPTAISARVSAHCTLEIARLKNETASCTFSAIVVVRQAHGDIARFIAFLGTVYYILIIYDKPRVYHRAASHREICWPCRDRGAFSERHGKGCGSRALGRSLGFPIHFRDDPGSCQRLNGDSTRRRTLGTAELRQCNGKTDCQDLGSRHAREDSDQQ